MDAPDEIARSVVRMLGRKHAECLPEIKAANEVWATESLPRLRELQAKREAERRAREAEQAEAWQALEWCRANGSPHKAAT